MCSFAENRIPNASAFSDNNFGYVVFGGSGFAPSNELWRFEPLDPTGNNELNSTEKSIQLFTDGSGTVSINFPKTEIYTLSIYDFTGKCLSSETLQVNTTDYNLIKKYNLNGLHFIQVKNSKNEILVNKKVVL